MDTFKRWLNISGQKSCILLGPRRSGKTTLLKLLFPEYDYITLDDLDYLDQAENDPKGLIDNLGDMVIIDEIQRAPRLTIAVKNAIDNQNRYFMMTGSNAIGLSGKAADTLAGRINLYNLPPICFGENEMDPISGLFSQTLDIKELKVAQRKLNDAITFGFFPEIINQNSAESKTQLLRNYRDSYFLRDLMQISNLENLSGLRIIFHHLARCLGSHLEISSFSRESGLSFPTTKKYLNALEQSQLVFKLYGYQYGPAKRYLKASKSYFIDNGIINSLKVKLNEGQLFENFVISEIEKRRKLGYLDSDQLYYYKSVNGKEIDLLFEVTNELYAVEIKNTSHPSQKDIRNLKEFGKSMNRPVKLFLFYNGLEYCTINGVKLIPAASLYGRF